MLSVIVPVYNVQDYLKRCVDSLINQTYRNLEIILIDDGSTDNSGTICDKYESLDNRIHVIHKENGGLADARNAGLDYAHSDWVSFIDADDYIDESAYQGCMEALEKTDADVCYFGNIDINKNGISKEAVHEFPERILNRKDIEMEIVPKTFGKLYTDKYGMGSVCMGVYRRSIIEENNLRFISERELLSEDYLFTTDFCMQVDTMVFLRYCYYYYCYNITSLSNSFREDRFEKTERFFLNRIEYIRTHELGDECRVRAEARFWDTNCATIYHEFDDKQLKRKLVFQRIREICESSTSKEILKRVDYRYYSPDKRIMLFLVKRHWIHMIVIAVWVRKVIKNLIGIKQNE